MTAIVMLSALFFTSLTMCAAMTLAWASFGHPRHARSWAIAFGLGAAQALVNAIAVAADRPAPLMLIAFTLVMLPGPLVAIGARQRARLPSRKRGFAIVTTLAIAIVIPATLIREMRPIALAATMIFSAACLLLAARAILLRQGKPQSAERVMYATLLILAGVEAVTGILIWATLTWPDAQRITQIYHVTIAVALPPASLCSGVAAILLVASDLAVELGWQAARDPLTCLFNRRGFQENAVRLLAGARRLRIPATLVLADIDHFKAINDRHGHAIGDRTLCFIAERLEQGVRQGDVVARIGGEEFALLLIDSTADQAIEVIERIRIAIADAVADETSPAPATVSFGIGALDSGDAPPDIRLASALDRADRALYLSKMGGRDRITVAT